MIPSVQMRPSLAARFGAFVLEQFPFAHKAALEAFNTIGADGLTRADAIDGARARLGAELHRRLAQPTSNLTEPTPRVSPDARWSTAVDALIAACDGFLRRAAIELSLTADERREI